MPNNINARMPKTLFETVTRIASDQGVSVSELFRRQMQRYASGELTLKKKDRGEEHRTTLLIDTELAEAVKKKAKEEGVSMDEAIRQLASDMVNHMT